MSNKDYRIHVYLQDILTASSKILKYTKGFTFEQFRYDEKTIDAVLRNFGIIGEAAKMIPLEIQKKYPTLNWRAMAGMRDKLIHDYQNVILEIVWETIKSNIPQLVDTLK